MKCEQPLAFQLRSLNNQIKRMLERTAIAGNDANLTGMQYAVLGFLSQQPEDRDVYQRDLEGEFNIRRSTATGILQLLEKNGLIRRESVAGDARLKRILLTDKARELEKKARENVDGLNRKLTRGISPEELERFYETLNKIVENAQG